jgi:hypothetical protein
MSKRIDEDDQVWPTRCPACDTELASAVIDFDQSNENRVELNPGEMVAVDYCPNPDCPEKATKTDKS